MFRTVLKLCVLVLTLSLALPALAASAYEIRRVLESGGAVTVGGEFSSDDIRTFIDLGKDRVTVRCKGFSTYDAGQFLSGGARLTVDSSYSSYDVRRFCEEGRQRISVEAAGFSDYDLRQFAGYGATIIGGGEAPGSLYELRRILEQGGAVTVGSPYSSYDIGRLIDLGKDRVTVVARGSGYDTGRFADAGARLIVDSSFSAYDVMRFCESAHGRVTVKAPGFSDYDLRRFAEQGAAVDYAKDRESVRAAKFVELSAAR